MTTERWGWRDTRTGKRIGTKAVRTQAEAEAYLAAWRWPDRPGSGSDLHEILSFVEVYQIEAPEAEQ